MGGLDHDLLRKLVDGTPLGEALTEALAGKESARQQARVFRWFRSRLREGLFSTIDSPSPV